MAKYSIGIDLGGTKILGAIVNIETGEVILSEKKKTKKERGSEVIIKKICNIIQQLLDESKIPLEEIDSIGIGLAGQVDRERGILLAAPNLDCFNVNFKNILEEKYGKPVFIGNDVVGTGVGSGIVINGKMYTGFTGTAGEIGHITVACGGRGCGCGGNGCLEAYASRTAIEQKIKGAIKKGHQSIIIDYIKNDGVIRSKHLKNALEQKDEVVVNCLTEAAEYLSSGLSSVINFLNPELIIMGGGLIDAIDEFFDLTKSKTIKKCLPTPSEKTLIEKAKLGDYSGVVGAALLNKYRSQND